MAQEVQRRAREEEEEAQRCGPQVQECEGERRKRHARGERAW